MLLMSYTFDHKNSGISFENKLDLLKNNSVEVVKVALRGNFGFIRVRVELSIYGDSSKMLLGLSFNILGTYAHTFLCT